MAPQAFLLDLDGTLYTDAGPIPGAVEAMAHLKDAHIPHRFVTNTSRRSRSAVVSRLRTLGFDVEARDVFTAVLAGAETARRAGAQTVAPYVAEAALPDLGEFELVGGTSGRAATGFRPDAVIVGDLGVDWSYDLLNEAFRFLMNGAQLIALSRDRYFQRRDGLALDAGPFVMGLEYAAGVEALVAGKPSRGFFEGAVMSLGVDAGPGAVAMVGDDVWSDVRGGQSAGLAGWLVRTGKFRPEVLEASGVAPDRVLDSVVDVTEL
jgi:HAD superfamily hydrolase (TIGR01458 family)